MIGASFSRQWTSTISPPMSVHWSGTDSSSWSKVVNGSSSPRRGEIRTRPLVTGTQWRNGQRRGREHEFVGMIRSQ
jgi:hypothetical protein